MWGPLETPVAHPLPHKGLNLVEVVAGTMQTPEVEESSGVSHSSGRGALVGRDIWPKGFCVSSGGFSTNLGSAHAAQSRGNESSLVAGC